MLLSREHRVHICKYMLLCMLAFLCILECSYALTINVNTAGTQFSTSQVQNKDDATCVSIGDINADGFNDVVIIDPIAYGIIYVRYGPLNAEDTNLTTTVLPEVGFKMTSTIANSYLCMSTIGDINNDGVNDIIFALSGTVYVVYGEIGKTRTNLVLNTMPASTGFMLTGMGARVVSVGDINNDTIPDILMGNWDYYGAGGFAGMAAVVYGEEGKTRTTLNVANAMPVTTGFRILPASVSAELGAYITTGDVDNDGIKDILVSAVGSPSEYVYVYYGQNGKTRGDILTATAIPVTDGFRFIADITADSSPDLGASIAVGDVNGDELNDMVIGSSFMTPSYGMDAAGGVFVIYGEQGRTRVDQKLTTAVALPAGYGYKILGSQYYSNLGDSVAIRDLNGDGVGDIIAAAPFWDYSGMLFIIYGQANTNRPNLNLLSGLAESAGFLISGGSWIGEHFDIGDMNNDGTLDVLVGGLPYASRRILADAVWLCPIGKKVTVTNGCQYVQCPTYVVPNANYVVIPELCTNNTYSATCNVSCAENYEGAPVQPVCLATGQWSVVSGCALTKCNTYVPPSGYQFNGTTCASVVIGGKCDVKCASGYTGTAVTDPVCQTGKVWSEPSGCEPIHCGAYTTYTPYVAGTCTNTTYTATCNVSCSPGYEGNPPPVTCQASGYWSYESGCNEIQCPPYVPNAAYKIQYTSYCADYSLGSTCYLSCNTGYQGYISKYPVCQANKTWSNPVGCVPKVCPTYVPPTGYSANCLNNTYSASCNVACAPGYEGLNSTIVCWSAAQWSSPSNACTKGACQTLQLPKEYIKGSCTGGSFNDSCDLTCAEGYSGAGGKVKCLADKNWESPSGCGSGSPSSSTEEETSSSTTGIVVGISAGVLAIGGTASAFVIYKRRGTVNLTKITPTDGNTTTMDTEMASLPSPPTATDVQPAPETVHVTETA